QVRLIGYATATNPVSVPAGQTVAADFALTPAAVPLDVVIVSATGQEQLKRESGSNVGTIDASKVAQEAGPVNAADLLNSRVPGVEVMQSGGTTGTGSRIRIRGATSLSLRNEPIIVVDGVRVDNVPHAEGASLNDHANWPANYEGKDSTGAFCILPFVALGICNGPVATVDSFNPLKQNGPFRQGVRQHYGVSASGGNEITTFYVSGDFQR